MTDAPNWIKARAECTLEQNLALIIKAIKDDVAKFNRLDPANRANRLFLVEPKESGIGVMRAMRVEDHRATGGNRLVVDPDYDQDFVHISPDASTITARRQDHFEITVRPCWNADTLTCDLYIGDRPFPLWNVSERMLEPLLFGDEE